VKKAFFLLLVFLTSFQLSGGYVLAAALATTPAPAGSAHPEQATVAQKHYNLFHFLNQLLNEETEEDYSKFVGLPATFTYIFYTYEPVFSVQNNHFLIHYAASIKGKLPTLYLLHKIFRL